MGKWLHQLSSSEKKSVLHLFICCWRKGKSILVFVWFIGKSSRSSHLRCSVKNSVKKGVPRNFAKFTEKHLCQSLFFNKVTDLRPAALLKKKLWHSCFSVNFAKFLRIPFLQSTSGRLLWRVLDIKFTFLKSLIFLFYTQASAIFSVETTLLSHMQHFLIYGLTF